MNPWASNEDNNLNIHQDEIVLSTLTNNWAGASQPSSTRPGLLPPIKHKLTTAVQNFPVIPPITAVKTRPSQSQSRDHQSHDDDGGEGGQDEVREQVKKRNRHLFKVYLVSLAQLLVVFLIVVSLTEVTEVRDFQRRNHWIGALATVSTVIFLFLWIVLIICFPTVRETPKYNFMILLVFTLCEGLLLGVMSADTRNRRMTYSFYNRYNKSNLLRRKENLTYAQSPPFRSLNNDILFPSDPQSNLSMVDNDSESREEFGTEEVSDLFHHELVVSTATLAVSYCIIICGVFVLINTQNRFDGDFMGGLLHALAIIILTVILVMVATRNIVWPRLWYAGFGAFFLWFFHRMVVFPLIALLFPFKMFSTTQTEEIVAR